MANRTVKVALLAEVGSYIQGMKNAAAATKDLASSTLDTAGKNKQSMQQIGLAAGAMGAAAAAGVGLAVKKFAEFDKAMSGVQAATHETAKNMHELREAALEAGARTAFSATEAAAGIEELAKAGVSTTAILNGGLNGALDLAAAGGLGVGQAAEIAATAMTQFSLSGARVPHIADLLAAAAGKAQGDVSDMGMALKQAGLVASQTGLSIEETTAGLASFASAGLLGSDAGTSFKSMLQRLTPQSEEAAGLMQELGISAYDAQGNFIGLEAFAGNLQDSLAGLTVEQRNSAMATIFGSDAVRAAAVLYEQGASGIASWTEKVNDAGYAQETAAIKMDNLAGDIEEFIGSFETALIRTGEAGDGLARKTVQSATAVVNAYNELPGAAQTATLGVGGFVAVAGTAASAFLLLAPRIAETRKALDTLGTEMPRTTAAMSNLGKATGIAGVVLATAIAYDQLVNSLINAQVEAAPAMGALTNSIATFLETGRATGELASVLGDDFDRLAVVVERAGESGNYLQGAWKAINTREAQADIAALDQALAGMVAAGHTEQATEFFMKMSRAALDSGVSVEELRSRFPGYTDAVEAAKAETALAEQGQKGFKGATDAVTGALKSEEKSLSDLMEEVREATGLVLGLRDASRGHEAAIDAAAEALKENGRTLDINTEKGRANEAALDAIASSANEVLQSMIDSGEPLDAVSAKLGTQREALIKAAEKFGMTKQAAEAYADSVLQIPTKQAVTVTTPGLPAAQSAVEAFRRSVERIPSFKNVTIRYDEVLGTTVQRGNTPGRVTERAEGGWVFGPGTGTSDSIPARLSNGEFVVNAAAARENAALLEAINGRRFADGGWVSSSSPIVNVSPAAVDLSALVEVTGRLEGRLQSIEQTVARLPADHQQRQRQAVR